VAIHFTTDVLTFEVLGMLLVGTIECAAITGAFVAFIAALYASDVRGCNAAQLERILMADRRSTISVPCAVPLVARPAPWTYRFAWPEMVVLPLALIIAGAAYAFWILGVLSLAGYPLQRFDSAMYNGTIYVELVLILPIWLFLRMADIGVRLLSRLFRRGLRAAGPAGMLPASKSIR
jgi:hypothetical protein